MSQRGGVLPPGPGPGPGLGIQPPAQGLIMPPSILSQQVPVPTQQMLIRPPPVTQTPQIGVPPFTIRPPNVIAPQQFVPPIQTSQIRVPITAPQVTAQIRPLVLIQAPASIVPAQPITRSVIQPPIVQSQPQIMQIQPQIMQIQPQIMQIQPPGLAIRPPTIQAIQPQILPIQSQGLPIRIITPQIVQSQPQIVQSQPQIVQSQPQITVPVRAMSPQALIPIRVPGLQSVAPQPPLVVTPSRVTTVPSIPVPEQSRTAVLVRPLTIGSLGSQGSTYAGPRVNTPGPVPISLQPSIPMPLFASIPLPTVTQPAGSGSAVLPSSTIQFPASAQSYLPQGLHPLAGGAIFPGGVDIGGILSSSSSYSSSPSTDSDDYQDSVDSDEDSVQSDEEYDEDLVLTPELPGATSVPISLNSGLAQPVTLNSTPNLGLGLNRPLIQSVSGQPTQTLNLGSLRPTIAPPASLRPTIAPPASLRPTIAPPASSSIQTLQSTSARSIIAPPILSSIQVPTSQPAISLQSSNFVAIRPPILQGSITMPAVGQILVPIAAPASVTKPGFTLPALPSVAILPPTTGIRAGDLSPQRIPRNDLDRRPHIPELAPTPIPVPQLVPIGSLAAPSQITAPLPTTILPPTSPRKLQSSQPSTAPIVVNRISPRSTILNPSAVSPRSQVSLIPQPLTKSPPLPGTTIIAPPLLLSQPLSPERQNAAVQRVLTSPLSPRDPPLSPRSDRRSQLRTLVADIYRTSPAARTDLNAQFNAVGLGDIFADLIIANKSNLSPRQMQSEAQRFVLEFINRRAIDPNIGPTNMISSFSLTK